MPTEDEIQHEVASISRDSCTVQRLEFDIRRYELHAKSMAELEPESIKKGIEYIHGNANGKANVSAQLVKELRDRTGAGFTACREALVEADGDIEQAINVLRKKGQAAAAKKAQRATSEGLVSCYIHAGGKIGVLVEVNCESDFVARTEDFQRLCHDVAMHIAALDPRFLRREEVTQEMLDREREIYSEQAKATGKPEP